MSAVIHFSARTHALLAFACGAVHGRAPVMLPRAQFVATTTAPAADEQPQAEHGSNRRDIARLRP